MTDFCSAKPETPDAPLWAPSPARVEASFLHAYMQRLGVTIGRNFQDYQSLWQWSVDDLESFWSSLWDFCAVIGDKGETVLADGDDIEKARFFPDARLNWAENMLRRRDGETAILFRGENGPECELSFAELNANVAKLQQFLLSVGVREGDRVAGYLPNLPETVVAAIATASIGAIWSSASPDFGVQGIVDRFGQIGPKVFFTADAYSYGGKVQDCLEKTRAIAGQIAGIEKIVVIPFIDPARDISSVPNAVSYTSIMDQPASEPVFTRVPFDHPLFIMFSSGTTGIPKCIVHGHGGPLLTLMKEHQLQCDIHPLDRVFYFTTCGWMMWNWQVTALASGATLMLYDGSPFYPRPEILWDYAQARRCTLFGTGAKYIDALKSHGIVPKHAHDLGSLKTMTSTGSPLVHESFRYCYDAIKADMHLASISGGTDIVSCFVIGNPISNVYAGEIQGAGLGYAVTVFDDSGQPIAEGAGSGEMVCTRPFPSRPVGFWNDPEGKRYHAAYYDRFPNVWHHGDWIERTRNHGFIIHGRSDATLNPGGVRIGTAEIYRQVEQIDAVKESIAVGQSVDGDERIVLFVCLKPGHALTPELVTEIKNRIRNNTSPRHVPAKILQVADIPRTKSNKIVELAVRNVINGRPVQNSEALANPEALELFRDLPELMV